MRKSAIIRKVVRASEAACSLYSCYNQPMSYTSDKQIAMQIANKVSDAGGRSFYVGGYVRDKLLGIDNKDIDIEVHGVTPNQLEEILDSIGERISIGESFGIYNLKGYDIDIAMPRKEENRGTGHKDFDICVDPFAGTYNAALRRDFTINAMMEDVLTGEIVDHFGGKEDLKNGVIRHVNEKTFAEDQLRVLRGAQFAARFEFEIADETINICQQMSLGDLACERVMSELTKALLKADKPSIFFERLRQMNQLHEWFPEVEALIDTPQNIKFHQEGDVWTHTMMVMDAAAKNRDKVPDPLAFMLAALCHDMGKPVSTSVDEEGIVHSYLHEIKGLPIVKTFLNRLTSEVMLTKKVVNTVSLHMKPNVLANNKSAIKSTNKMYDQSLDPYSVIYLAKADYDGMIAPIELPDFTPFLLERLDVYNEYMARPHVMGRDLIKAGLKPGNDFKELLAHAHKLRLAGVKKEAALKQVMALSQKQKGKKK